jgi:nucleoside-diphosphate-sugar epimerase
VYERLSGASVLVTGGAGFVGSALVRALLQHDARVVALDNFLSGRAEHLSEVADRITLIEGDVLDRERLAEVFRAHEPSHVFHLVGDTFVPSAYHHPLRFLRVNIEGTLNVLEAVRDFGVERMLYVSSTEVYGQAGTNPIKESQALAPVNTYAVTKLAADRLCHTFHLEHRVPVVIARIFNCYGPRETQPYVIPEIIRQLARGHVVHLGNRNAARDFTFVDDTALGIMAVMGSDLPDGEPVHVGSGHLVTLETIVTMCAELMGRGRVEVEWDPRRDRAADIDAFHADTSRIGDATGWAPMVDLAEGLRRTVDWFRSNGSRWVWEEWCAEGVIHSPQPLAEARDKGSRGSG